MKNALIIISVLVLIVAYVFLYLLISGADESRRRTKQMPKEKADNEETLNGM